MAKKNKNKPALASVPAAPAAPEAPKVRELKEIQDEYRNLCAGIGERRYQELRLRDEIFALANRVNQVQGEAGVRQKMDAEAKAKADAEAASKAVQEATGAVKA